MNAKHHTLGAVAIVTYAALVLLVTACGSSSNPMGLSSSSAGGFVRAPSAPVKAAEQVQLENEYLRFARCMRSRGVSDFPDPITGSDGHPGFSFTRGSTSNLDSNNPTFQRDVRACQHLLRHQFRFVFTPSGAGKGA